MSQCGHECHHIQYPRYAETDGIIVCDWCLGKVPGWNKCETVIEDEEAEEQAVNLEYLKAKKERK